MPLEIAAVPEKAHEPACVSTCPAKAMKWDTKANILAYLKDPANGYTLANGTQNWIGNGARVLGEQEDHAHPAEGRPVHRGPHRSDDEQHALDGSKLLRADAAVGGLAALSVRQAKVPAESIGHDQEGRCRSMKTKRLLFALVLPPRAVRDSIDAAFANFAIHGNYVRTPMRAPAVTGLTRR